MTGRVAVVGASVGGIAAAEALRRNGYEGPITMVDAESCSPYDRPPLSKQILDGRWTTDRVLLRTEEELEALALDLRLGVAASGLDPASQTLALSDGTEVRYDALVVATGAGPRSLDLPGAGATVGVHFLRTLADSVGLRSRLARGRRLVIIGAGFIGTEVAAVARSLGIDVTLVEPLPQPLAHILGGDVAGFITRTHVERGVDLRTGIAVEEIVTAKDAVTGVRLSDGTVLPADDVLVAVGSTPGTDWLRDSGLAIDSGLICDEFCVAAPGIYGVGDVARWHNPLFGVSMRIEHRTNAAEQGLAVAYNLLHPEAPRSFAPVPYFWTDQYELKVQSHGYLAGCDEQVLVEGSLARRQFVVAYRTAERLAAIVAVGMPPKTVRAWRLAVAARTEWAAAVSAGHLGILNQATGRAATAPQPSHAR